MVLDWSLHVLGVKTYRIYKLTLEGIYLALHKFYPGYLSDIWTIFFNIDLSSKRKKGHLINFQAD